MLRFCGCRMKQPITRKKESSFRCPLNCTSPLARISALRRWNGRRFRFWRRRFTRSRSRFGTRRRRRRSVVYDWRRRRRFSDPVRHANRFRRRRSDYSRLGPVLPRGLKSGCCRLDSRRNGSFDRHSRSFRERHSASPRTELLENLARLSSPSRRRGDRNVSDLSRFRAS